MKSNTFQPRKEKGTCRQCVYDGQNHFYCRIGSDDYRLENVCTSDMHAHGDIVSHAKPEGKKKKKCFCVVVGMEILLKHDNPG